MTIDATVPTAGTGTVDQLDGYIRENRVQINSLLATVDAQSWVLTSVVSTYAMTAGQNDLVVGTHVGNVVLELVNLTAGAAEDLQNITGARAGNVKIIRFGDNNITVKHNDSKIKLPGSTDYSPNANDVLVLVNVGGDGAGVDGIWAQVTRQIWT